MDDKKISGKVIRSAIIATMAPLIYGMCLVLSSLLAGRFKGTQTNLMLLIFGGAFISNIMVSKSTMEKTQLLFSAALLYITGLGMCLNSNITVVYIGRLLTGLASGIVTNTTPCYLSLIAPVRYRGMLSALFGNAIISGLILGYALCYWKITVTHFIGIQMLLCLMMGALLSSCQKLSLENDFENRSSFFSFIAMRKSHRSLFLIALCHFAQQASGVNHILFSAKSIFPGMDETFLLLCLCSFALSTGLFASTVVDKFGRKYLLLLSSLVTMISCVAFFFAYNPRVFAFLYILGYNLGLSGIPYILISEIFPTDVISHGALFSTSCNWMAAFTSVIVSGAGTEKYNKAFLFYIGYLVVFATIITAMFRETKGCPPMYQ